MKRTTYARFEHDELSLRDLLAVDRTIVAIERTLLGYIRTTLAVVGAGAALVHFFPKEPIQVAGWGLVASGLPILGLGIWHYVQRRRSLAPLIR